MNAHNDITALQRRVDHLTRAAARIRAQLADLHSIAWEPSTASQEPGERVSGGRQDWTPRSGPEAAKALWRRSERELAQCEAVLSGLERKITGWFMVTAAVEPTRGSLIKSGDFDQELVNQNRRRARGDYTPARLMDQPPHSGKRR